MDAPAMLLMFVLGVLPEGLPFHLAPPMVKEFPSLEACEAGKEATLDEALEIAHASVPEDVEFSIKIASTCYDVKMPEKEKPDERQT